MAFILGLLIGFILGFITMFFLWVSVEANKQKRAIETGIIQLYKDFFYITKIKEENKNEQN